MHRLNKIINYKKTLHINPKNIYWTIAILVENDKTAKSGHYSSFSIDVRLKSNLMLILISIYWFPIVVWLHISSIWCTFESIGSRRITKYMLQYVYQNVGCIVTIQWIARLNITAIIPWSLSRYVSHAKIHNFLKYSYFPFNFFIICWIFVYAPMCFDWLIIYNINYFFIEELSFMNAFFVERLLLH